MKREFEFEAGVHDSLWIEPIHKSRKEEGATVESLCAVRIEAMPPTWRDFWAIFRGRYVARVRVREIMTLAATDLMLKEIWTSDRLEEQLHSPLFDRLVSGSSGSATVRLEKRNALNRDPSNPPPDGP